MTYTISVRNYLLWLLLVAILIGIIEIKNWEIKGQRETICRLSEMLNDKVTAMIFENGRFVGQITQ